MHDLIIRNGLIYDGTGAAPRDGDVAVDGGKISAVGHITERGQEEIDATGQIVTPGFVDVHTHYDAQVTWDPYLQPSTFHGVTTVVLGNCGVGFAPCRPDRHDWLIGLMEGVEDIPGAVLSEGIKWGWESFPDYMSVIEQSPLAIDIGLQMPHGALRAYVMGERGTQLEPASAADTAAMARLVIEALNAGALGFSTSRTNKHRDRFGQHTPSLKAEALELHGIARAMGQAGKGVIQMIGDFRDFDYEFGLVRGMVEMSGRPASITIEQDDRSPETWRKVLDGISQAVQDGLPMKGQVPPRPTGVLMGLTASLNPFSLHETFREIAGRPLDAQVAALRDPAFRARLLAEQPTYGAGEIITLLCTAYHKMFTLGDPPNYEPSADESAEAQARARGLSARDMVLEMMLAQDGKALLYFPIMNYLHGNLDDVRTMMTHPNTSFGLSDGGAHCGILCDASFPTTLLSYWGRDRVRGPKLPLEWLIQGQTKRSAELVGLYDRGVLAPGMKADINVIDFDHLTLHAPRAVYDLPAGGKRMIQKADGYTASIVGGTVTFRDGQPAVKPIRSALKGRLIRGAQSRPAGSRIPAAAE